MIAASAEEKLEAVRIETENKRRALAATVAANDDTQARIAALDAQLEQLVKDIASEEAAVHEAARKHADLRRGGATDSDVRSHLLATAPRVDELDAELTRRHDELEHARDENHITHLALARVAEYQRRLERDTAKQLALKARLKGEIDSARKERAKLAAELKASQKQLRERASNLQRQQRLVTETIDEIARIQALADKVQNKIHAASSTAQKMYSQRQEAKRKAEDAARTSDSVLAEVAQVRAENERLVTLLYELGGEVNLGALQGGESSTDEDEGRTPRPAGKPERKHRTASKRAARAHDERTGQLFSEMKATLQHIQQVVEPKTRI